MLADYYPPRLRASVLAIYSSGVYIGAGIGIFLGGWIVDSWQAAYADASQAPFGMKGWRAAYVIVGIPGLLPGLLMALWVFTLREPRLLRHLVPEETHRIDRARAAGEPVATG